MRSVAGASDHPNPDTIPTAQTTTPETQDMQLSMTRSTRCLLVLLPLVVGGCQRGPIGGCPFEDLEAPTDFITPWDTVLGQDMAKLAGPYHGTLTWGDGEDVITVPKAGRELEVEATIEFDPTATMRVYESTREQPYCETDYLFAEATITFVRLDDGEMELIAPFTLYRDTDASPQYDGIADITPISEFLPDLIPLQNFDREWISAQIWWNPEATRFRAEYSYLSQSTDSPSTGSGVSKDVVKFDMAE
jgi:hypothetical protein